MNGSATHLVVERFPARTETFIRRHAIGLSADVICGTVDKSVLQEFDFPGSIHCLGAGTRGFKPSLVNKLFYRAFPDRRSHQLSREIQQRFIELWKTDRPGVVLAEFGTNGIRVADLCDKLGIPLAIHFHGYDASQLMRITRYRTEIRRATKIAAAVIVVSGVMRDTLLDNGTEPEKVHVIPYGAPLSEFVPSQDSLPSSSSERRFIAVGRMVEKKAPLLTLRAFQRCHEQFPDTSLTYVGDGPLFPQARKFVDDAGLGQVVSLLGACNQQRIKVELGRADCFLQHSITSNTGNREGWPVAIGEAMASGLAVISTNHAGIIDQIDHGTTGFRVDEHDWKSMAEYMCRIAEDAELTKSMGEASRERIEEIGDCEASIAALAELMSDVGSTGRGRHRHGSQSTIEFDASS